VSGERARRVVEALRGRGETLAVAESLTGGLLAATVVEVPGASAVLRGGLIVYAVDLKATLAGVPEGLLAERGPVDPDVATALARGARDRCDATWGLATTGVAGPDSHGGHPAGTVWLGLAGLAGPDGAGGPAGPGGAGLVRAELLRLGGDRAAVRAGSVDAALDLLLDALGEAR
jgi:nicotinamide-nucleotide amidase